MLMLAPRIQRSPRSSVPFDWAGQLLALIALGSIIYALIEGGAIGYGDPLIVTLLVTGVTALALFLLVQARAAHPMMPLTLFHTGAMRVALFGGFAFIYAWFGSVFLVSLYLQQHLNITPALAGLVFLPSAVLSFFGNLASGPLANRFGRRVPVLLGMGSLVIGLSVLAFFADEGSVMLVAIVLILIGGGGSVAMPPLAGVVLEYAPEGQAGVASAVSNTFRQVGGALAVAVFGMLVARDDGFLTGMQLSLATAALLALTSLIGSTTLTGGQHAHR